MARKPPYPPLGARCCHVLPLPLTSEIPEHGLRCNRLIVSPLREINVSWVVKLEQEQCCILPKCIRGSCTGEFQTERSSHHTSYLETLKRVIMSLGKETSNKLFFHPFVHICRTEKSLPVWIFFLAETQFVFSFSEYYSISFVSFYLNVNTTFKADKLQGLGFLAFRAGMLRLTWS